MYKRLCIASYHSTVFETRKFKKKVLTFPFQGLKHKNILRYIMFEMHFYKIGNIDNNERQKMIY
jgi:hypothetical protein